MGTEVVAVMAMLLTVTPDNGGLLLAPQITINNQAGDQFDPHVDQNLAAYSNAVDTLTSLTQEIRYYEFSSDKDLAIPNTLPNGTRANDLLSDVDQGRIVFTRIFPGDRSAIMLFDSATQATTELAPTAGSNRIGVALGAQTVAFVDYGATGDGSGEIMVLNLATSAVTRLTNDLVFDANPAVSPDGNVVTWERCASFANCDIYQAARSGSLWIIQAVSSSILNERSADSNGTQVVFERDDLTGPSGSNIVMVPVAGGAETVLDLPGEQYNPSIRGPIVAFESRVVATANSDIYLVELTTNRVFQITQTPAFSESLNDVTVLPAGEVRLVWQANDEIDPTKGNIYGATFSLPALPPPPDAGTGGGGGSGGGSCLNRSVALEATRFYSPTRSVDGTATFNPPMAFAIPATVPVLDGNAANKKVFLTINLGSKTIRCQYRGGSAQAHPDSAGELALASRYSLTSCKEGEEEDEAHSAPSYGAGSVVAARGVKLHIQNGDMTLPLTRVGLVLGEVCPASVSSPLDVSNPIDAPQTAGCSSSGASLAPFLAAFAFLALMLRRPASIRLVVRREQRRLPR